MRQLFVILVAGLVFISPVLVGAQVQTRPQSESTPGRTPSGGQLQSDPSPGRTSPGGPSLMQDTEHVRKAQEKLKAAGFDPGTIDGNLGPQTREAIRDFQKARGLPQTGTLDQETQRSLMAGGTTGGGSTMGGSTGTQRTPGSSPGTGTMGGSSGTGTSPGSSPGSSMSPGGSTGGSSERGPSGSGAPTGPSGR